MNNETGGPAFPFIDSASPLEHSGMTLRDFFAAKAMQAILSTLNEVDGEPRWNVIAKDSYKMAAVMLEARK